MKKFFIKLQAYLCLRSKIAEANARHKQDGKRYYVIPVKRTLQVVNIEEALTLKKQGSLPADFSNKLVYNIAYYWSDTKAPKPAAPGAMPSFEIKRRRQVFYRWFANNHK